MKNKLAIFDLDGTLFNTNNVNYLSYKLALKEFGYDLDYEYFCSKCNGMSYKKFLPNILNGNMDIIDEIHMLKKDLYSTNLEKAIINNHLFKIIELIKEEYYLAVVTTASKKNCEEILKYFNKFELFDLILTHEDVEKVKPNPEGFIKAMNFFGMKPEATLIFEDSPVGIEAAKKSEANVFAVNKF